MACHDMAYPLLIFYRNGWPVPVTISAIQSNSFWGAMRAASLKVMGLGEDNNCSHFGWVFCFVIFSAQYLNLFRHRVLTGSWARQLFCLRAPGMLSLSCRLTVLLMGGGYYLWLWFFYDIHTAPIIIQACLQMIRLYRGVLSLASHSTILRAYYCLF